MNVVVNGQPRELPVGATVADVVELLSVARSASGSRGIAVALDGTVVRHGAWPSTELADGARIEVLSAIGGG